MNGDGRGLVLVKMRKIRVLLIERIFVKIIETLINVDENLKKNQLLLVLKL